MATNKKVTSTNSAMTGSAGGTKKKTRRRMKKQVRRTIAGLFMASAIAVAAIPVDTIQASIVGGQVTHVVKDDYKAGTDTNSHHEKYGDASQFKPTATAISYYTNVHAGVNAIPICKADSTIYQTGDGHFQFAYVDSTGDQNGSGDKFAVILGYNFSGGLPNNTLTIPNSVDAYLNFDDNNGSSSGFCSVGKSGNFLFYENKVLDVEHGADLPSGSGITRYYVQENSKGKTVIDPNTNKELAIYRVYRYEGGDKNNGGVLSPSYAVELDEIALKDYLANTEVNGLEHVNFEYSQVMLDTYHNFEPCFYSTYDTWVNSTLFYYPNPATGYKPPVPNTDPSKIGEAGYDTKGNQIPLEAADQLYSRMSAAEVDYIGNQYLEPDGSAGWKIAGVVSESSDPTNNGVFSGKGNITYLEVDVDKETGESDLSGIGDYAFYGCSAMKSISTGNGLNTLGNHAFDYCANLQKVTIPEACNLTTIGAYCFKDCRALTDFTLPINVRVIGDGAFKNCSALQTIDLRANIGAEGGANGLLESIGNYAFMGCTNLQKLELPSQFNQTLELSEFEGCKNLASITVLNDSLQIVPSTTCSYDWDNFKADHEDGSLVKEKFYIEAKNTANVHKIATDNEVAFKYLGEDIYEVTKKEHGINGSEPTVTYKVNGQDELIDTVFNKAAGGETASTLSFPAYVGTHTISSIGDGAFINKCTLTEVDIPSTINSIGKNAFMGCHNLKYVHFASDTIEIGENAFKTQWVNEPSNVSQHVNCIEYSGTDSEGDPLVLHDKAHMKDTQNKPTVELGFVGKIDYASTPYSYAMNDSNGRYNGTDQSVSYIKFFSGWPEMLTVQYVVDTDASSAEIKGHSELVDFPTLDALGEYKNKDYLSANEKLAANNAATYATQQDKWGELTEAAQRFVGAAYTLTIPTGVTAIKDGLFYELTEGTAAKQASNPAMHLVIKGLDTIETNDAGGKSSDTCKEEKIAFVPDAEHSDFYGCSKIADITFADDSLNPQAKVLEDSAFADCANLQKVLSNTGSPIERIGDHAFKDDDKLDLVKFMGDVTGGIKRTRRLEAETDKNGNSIPVEGLGLAPWYSADILGNVSFEGGNTPYRTTDSIVFGLDENGNNRKVVELLCARNFDVEADELAGVKELAEEGFASNTKVERIDLSQVETTKIPTHLFEGDTNLDEVILPDNQHSPQLVLSDYIFEGSTVHKIKAYSNIISVGPYTFDGIITASGGTTGSGSAANKEVTIYAADPSTLRTVLENNSGYDIQKMKETVFYSVKYYDYNPETGTEDKLVATDSVEAGAKSMKEPIPVGKTDANGNALKFDKWMSSDPVNTTSPGAINSNVVFTASYIYEEGYGQFKVTYVYFDENADPDHTNPIELDYEFVNSGEMVKNIPTPPKQKGWTFTDNWNGTPSIKSPVTQNVTYEADYDPGYRVIFRYKDPETGKMVTYLDKIIEVGSDAAKQAGSPDAIDGYKWGGWTEVSSLTEDDPDIHNIQSDLIVSGQYLPVDSPLDAYAYVHYIVNGKDGWKELVEKGTDAPAYTAADFPGAIPSGYKLDGWDGDLTNIQHETWVNAILKKTSNGGGGSSSGGGGSSGGSSGNKKDDDNKTTTGNSSSGNSSSKKTYTVTVVNGSGSGTYEKGAVVVIAANDPGTGKAFSKWKTSDVTLASTSLSATTFTMPDKNVTVTAEYVDSATSKTVGNPTGNAQRPTGNSKGSTATGSTSVVVSKGGVSNTDLASATVHGSTDGFVVRITETNEATMAVENALNNRFGGLDNLRYWACDISLYDSTGNTKITDTSGLSVDVTVPIPDELRQYGGNNKAGAVANNQLEDLSVKYNTVNGTPTMTFTATHFSPYVIYADTANLNASEMLDASPKTGDPIHPKWFLAIGLACVSVILFLKKDKRKVVATA